jgi:hypothetical protein
MKKTNSLNFFDGIQNRNPVEENLSFIGYALSYGSHLEDNLPSFLPSPL